MNTIAKTIEVWRLTFGVFICLLSNSALGVNEEHNLNKITHFASWLWGTPTKTQIQFLPFGYHFLKESQPNNKQWLVSGILHGVTVGSFISSCNKRIFYEGIQRQVFGNKFVSINYLLGVMEGYGGSRCDLKKDLGPILGHDPGPLAALDIKFYLSEHLSIDLANYGVGGLGGISYIF